MTTPARINLVRADALRSSEGLLATSTGYSEPDEVELLNPDGDAAAVVLGAGYVPADIVYEYSDGSLGLARRRMRHTISMGVDYIGDRLRAKLEKWMRDRAMVLYCPGYGRHTDLALRPLVGSSATLRDGSTQYRDLTGRYALTHTGSSGPWWDADLRVLRGPFGASSARRVVPTPAGAGQVFERAKVQRMRPTSPLGANEGNDTSGFSMASGWTKAGSHAADLTFQFANSGFGHSSYPHALRVTADDGTNRERRIQVQTLWDSTSPNYGGYTFTGSSVATVSIWLRGRVGAGASVGFRHGGMLYEEASVDLDEVDLSEWTKISLELSPYDGDWSTHVPLLYVDLPGGATAGGNPVLEVGPTFVSHGSGTPQRVPEPGGVYATATTADRNEVASYRFPSSGSAMCSFWWPADMVLSATCFLLVSTQTGSLGSLAVTNVAAQFYRAASGTLSGAITPRRGAINTVCAVWESGDEQVHLYFNGALVASSGTGRRLGFLEEVAALRIGHNSSPLLPLTWRIDRRCWSAQDVAEYDTGLRDPACNALAVHARGRQYRIVSIPSVPRNQQGGTVFVGELVLEEYRYDHNLGDLTSQED